MYCKNCGALVTGRYCSRCGTKIRSDVDQYVLDKRRVQKEYEKTVVGHFDGLPASHLATACWYAYECKLLKSDIYCVGDNRFLAPDAYERLAMVRKRATALYNRLKTEAEQGVI